MSIGLQGQNLIFLISQPRAGSTLLQRILGSHPDIHTVSEPWLMLHPLYALRNDGHQAEYNAHKALNASEGFLQQLPSAEHEYIEGVRRMYSYLYGRAQVSSGKRYFMDKTPRYYFIIPELYRTFPEAHFVILLRNPLAALCSRLRTRIKENWFALYNGRHDLVRAPRLLIEGIEVLGERGMLVHYERLVSNPESEVKGICRRLGIEFVPDMVEYGRNALPYWRLGDQIGVYQHKRPMSQNVEKWTQALVDPQIWRLLNDYLELLRQETIKQMGYDYESLQQQLEEYRPRKANLMLTFSLPWLLKKPEKERKNWEHSIVSLARFLQRQGIGGMAVVPVRILMRFGPSRLVVKLRKIYTRWV